MRPRGPPEGRVSSRIKRVWVGKEGYCRRKSMTPQSLQVEERGFSGTEVVEKGGGQKMKKVGTTGRKSFALGLERAMRKQTTGVGENGEKKGIKQRGGDWSTNPGYTSEGILIQGQPGYYSRGSGGGPIWEDWDSVGASNNIKTYKTYPYHLCETRKNKKAKQRK